MSRCSRDPKSWATNVPHQGFHSTVFRTYRLMVGQSAERRGPSVDIHYVIVFYCVSSFVFGYATTVSFHPSLHPPLAGLFCWFQVISSTIDCHILPDCMHSIIVSTMTSVYIDACLLSVCWCTVFTLCSFVSQASWTLSHWMDLLER